MEGPHLPFRKDCSSWYGARLYRKQGGGGELEGGEVEAAAEEEMGKEGKKVKKK